MPLSRITPRVVRHAQAGLGALAFALASGCTSQSQQATTTAQSSSPTATESPAASAAPAPAASETTAQALRNGKAIFQTGIDLQRNRITAQPPPLMNSCAGCHTLTGSGGVHLPGGAVSADLRHPAMVTQQKPPYTIAMVERAISKGVDNQGHPLSPVMPRWKMSQRDLHDVALYVLSLK
jgi:mono/diheme cytochrome c family protein